MRTNEERIAEMHARAKELNRQKRTHRVRILQSAFAAACFAAVILMAVYMPKTVTLLTDSAAASSEDMQASIFIRSGAIGYVVIAVIAFLLGMTVTVFCFCLKKWQEEKEQEEDL
jgi:membrane protein DedA with SNARE-associated domain